MEIIIFLTHNFNSHSRLTYVHSIYAWNFNCLCGTFTPKTLHELHRNLRIFTTEYLLAIPPVMKRYFPFPPNKIHYTTQKFNSILVRNTHKNKRIERQ